MIDKPIDRQIDRWNDRLQFDRLTDKLIGRNIIDKQNIDLQMDGQTDR